MEMSIGIDLGTTNTVVSIARMGVHGIIEVDTEKISQISEDKITPVSDELLPSVFYLDDQGIPYIGQVAKAMKSQNRKRVIHCSKNFMGMSNYTWDIDGKKYSPELVASYFLKAVRNFLKSKYINEDLLKSAVITVPASFDIDQRRATKTAARLAGFEDSKVMLISEPTAAILDFINEQRKFDDASKTIDFSKGKNVLVFDLGGGTCDVSILSIKMLGDKVNVEEIAVSPHTLLGGNNFDTYAALGIIDKYSKINKMDLRALLDKESFKELVNQLIIRCEKAKLFFSGRYENMKNLEEGEREKSIENLKFPIGVPNAVNGKAFMYELSMKEYNQLILPLLKEGEAQNVIKTLKETLVNANMEVDNIDHVFCVGGMTMYPTVVDTLREFFKKEPMSVLSRMNSVSRGAAVFHHYNINISERNSKVQEGSNNLDVVPTMPQSIFLDVKDNLPIVLIEEKTKAGTPIIHEGIVMVNSELGVKLELYAGRSAYDPELKRLKNINLNFDKYAVPKGTPISLKLEYSKEGILNFEAWLADDKKNKIDVCIDDIFMSEEQINKTIGKYELNRVQGVL